MKASLRKIVFLAIIYFAVLGWAESSWAASWIGKTCTPGSFTSAEVSTCLAEAASKTGEIIIQLPTGTSIGTWSMVSVNMSSWTTPTKLTIQGNGITNTIISLPTAPYAFAFTGKSGIPFRLTGIEFSGTNVHGAHNQTITIGGNCTNWRIDNNHFYRTKNGNDIWVTTYNNWGVIDSNIFEDSSQEGITPQYGNSDAIASWTDVLTPGSANAVYIENNTFTYTSNYASGGIHVVTGFLGSRYVFRSNTITLNDGTEFDSVIDMHSSYYISGLGYDATRWTEVYNNNVSGTSVGWALNWRGGNGIAFSNTFSDTQRDCIVLGGDNMLAAYCANLTACPYPNPGQMTTGYMWSNSCRGTPNTAPYVKADNYIRNYIQINRDYNIPTSGVYADKPATCTHTDGYINKGYWATDQNKLYICTGMNNWTAYYTPYTYPHPLTLARSGDATPPAAPQGLSVK